MSISVHAINDPAQVAALATLLELEARWETTPLALVGGDLKASVQALQSKQKLFDAYHEKMMAYNARYKPGHQCESPINTPARLAAWCRKARDLYARVETHAKCPVNLLEKAYRIADRFGVRLNRDPFTRAAALTETRAAIAELGALAEWCDGLTQTPVVAWHPHVAGTVAQAS